VKLDSYSPTLESMQAKNEIIIGTKTDQPGLSHHDPKTNRWNGFDVGIENLIAAKLGFSADQIVRVSAETGDLAQLVKDGRIHLAISAYTITTERSQEITFARPYFESRQSILVRRDEMQITGKDTLHGKRICTGIAVTGATKLASLGFGQKVVHKANTSECVDALLGDPPQVDAVSTDEAILASFRQLHPDKLKIVGEPFSNEPWGVGIAKGDKALCEKISQIIQGAMDDGTLLEIFDATLSSAGVPFLPIPNIQTCT